MKRKDAEVLFDVYERALKVLSEAEAVIWKFPEGEERDAYVRDHTGVIADIVYSLRGPLVLQYRDLDTDVYEGPPDTYLEPDKRAVVEQLTAAQVQRIDEALLADCAPTWRKVARVVGSALSALRKELPGVPDSYYAQRVVVLVSKGLIESEGNLDYMRYSEVRLRQDAKPDA